MQKPGFKRGKGFEGEKKEFDQHILDIARVTRVTKGGKHMSFRVCVIIGDRRGRVGFGVAKGKDVQLGVEKAVNQAKKHLIRVPIVHETIPHAIVRKFKAAVVMIKPAPKGSGIIAGGATRAIFELAGVPNVSSKIVGTSKNKITIVKATFEALQMFKRVPAKKTEKPVEVADVKPTEAPMAEKAVKAKSKE